MSGHEELFEAFGLKKVAEDLWHYQETFKDIDEREANLVVARKQDGSFTGYVCKGDAIPEKGIIFTSDDFRDMVALAQNERASAYGEATHDSLDEGFEDKKGGFFITKCFMNGEYFDYDIDGRSLRSKYWRLKSPANTFGSAYTEWRDGFCERLLNPAVPAP